MKFLILLVVFLYSGSSFASDDLRLFLTLDGSNKVTIHSDRDRYLIKFDLAENSVPQVYLYKNDQGRFKAVNEASSLVFYESEKVTKFKGLQTRIWMLENGQDKPRQFVEDLERASSLTDDIPAYYEAKEGFAEGSKISELKKQTQAKILKSCNIKIGANIDKKPLSSYVYKVNAITSAFTKLCQNPDYAETVKTIKTIQFSKSPNSNFSSVLEKAKLKIFIPWGLENTTEVSFKGMANAVKVAQAAAAAAEAEAAALKAAKAEKAKAKAK